MTQLLAAFRVKSFKAVVIGLSNYKDEFYRRYPLCRRPAMPPIRYAADPLCRQSVMPPTPIMCVVANTSTRGDQHRSCLYDI